MIWCYFKVPCLLSDITFELSQISSITNFNPVTYSNSWCNGRGDDFLKWCWHNIEEQMSERRQNQLKGFPVLEQGSLTGSLFGVKLCPTPPGSCQAAISPISLAVSLDSTSLFWLPYLAPDPGHSVGQRA